MAETTNFTSLQTTEGYVGDVTGNLVGDTTGTHTGDVKTSSIQDLQGTEQIGVSASGINVVSNLTVGGNLTVLGGETILDVQKLEVEDYNIVIGKNNETSGVLNGSGITLHGGTGTDITFQYGSNGYMYLSNKLQVVEEVKTQTITADAADITDLRASVTGDVTGNVTGQVSDISNHSTTDLTEGNNLYWTPARSDARIALQTGANLDLSQKTTSELSEGVNLYYTEARVDANIASKSTDDLAEGSNLYFTDARVRANRLDQMAAPTTSVSLNSQTISDLAEPQAISDAATKQYVDNAVSSKDDLSELSGTTDDLTEGTTNLFLTPNAQTIDGNKTFTGATVVSGSLTVPAPTGGTQAANKDYVDNAIASIDELSELLGSTDDVQEGSTNLYYTDARVHAAISAGTGVTYDGSGEFSIGQPVGTSDNVSFGKVYVRTGTGVGVDLNSQTNNASLRFHTSAGQTGIISTSSGNAPVQVYASLLWARAINGGTGNLMADGDVTVGGDLAVTGTISSPTITALEASVAGDVSALQSELDATQTGAGLNPNGSYLQDTGANYIQGSTSLAGADSDLDTALKAEETARIAADTTLQSNIDAEEAARIAADSTLQSNIDSEEAARIAGDASTLSSANSYTDTSIANLVDSAPATLDTLNELAAALADDPNFATTITNQVSGVQTNLDTEEAARIAADSTLQSNIDSEAATRASADTTLQSNIDSEASTRAAADTTLQSNIDAEAATRSSADSTLQSNIDTVAANLASEISATDAEITALQAADVTLQSNIDAEETARQSADTTLQSNIDSEASTRAAADTTLQSNIDTVASDLASEISTTDAEITALQSADSAEAAARAAADATLQSNIDTEEAARISGDAATLAAAKAYSDSLDHDTAQLEADVAQLQTDLATETSNRTSADTTLQSNIDTVAANLATEIATTDSEISALQAADTAEASARATADTTLQSNIDTVAADLASEISTTNSEISALQAQDTTLQSNIDTEEAARIAGDASTLSSAQSYTDTAVANLVDSAPATLDTLNELAAALGDDPNFATTVTTSIGTKLNTADFDSTFDTRLATKTTGDLTEGSNLYYTDARVASYLSSGASVDINSSLSTGDITIDAGGDEAKLTFVLETNGGADTGSIIFTRNSGGADIGAIKYVRSQDALSFYTNGTTTADLTIDSAGKVIANNTFDGNITNSSATLKNAVITVPNNATKPLVISNPYPNQYSVDLTTAAWGARFISNATSAASTVLDVRNGNGQVFVVKNDGSIVASGTMEVTGGVTTDVTGTVSDISNHDTDALTEGSTNLYFTDARSRASISAGGDLSYNSTTGVVSFTERTDAEVNSLADARIALNTGANLDLSSKTTTELAEGTNLYYTDARVDARIAAASVTDLSDVDQALATTDAVSFEKVTVNQSGTDYGMVINQNHANAGLHVDATSNGITIASADTTFGGVMFRAFNGNSVGVTVGTDGNTTFSGNVTAQGTILLSGTPTQTGHAVPKSYVDAIGNDVDDLVTLSGVAAGSLNLGTFTGSTISDTSNIKQALQALETSLEANTSPSSTDDLSEGSTNLYYTDARVGSYLTTNSYATQSYVDTAVANVVDSAPATLDTLNELAAALGDDPNFATTTTNLIGTKLATADFSTTFDSNLATKTTDNLTEGTTNVYYTDARSRAAISVSGDLTYNSTTGVISFTERTDAEVNSLADARIALNTGANLDLSGKSTTDLSEGTNLYYTDARVDARIALQTGSSLDLSGVSTTDLSEGSNFYFTDSRARLAISVSGDLAYNSTTGVISFTERTDAEVNTLADARIALNTGANLDLSSKDSDDLAEGTTNLFFTNERVDDRVNSLLVAGSSKITLSYNDVANTLTIDNGNAYFQGISGASNQITTSHTLGAYTVGLTPTVDVTTRLRINNTSSAEAFAVTGNSDLEGDLSVTGRIFEVGETSQTFDNANNGAAANNIDITEPVNFIDVAGTATNDVYLHLPKGADGQILNLILSPSYSSIYTIYISDTGTYQTNMYGTASFSSYQRTLRLRYSNSAGKWMNLGGDAYVSY